MYEHTHAHTHVHAHTHNVKHPFIRILIFYQRTFEYINFLTLKLALRWNAVIYSFTGIANRSWFLSLCWNTYIYLVFEIATIVCNGGSERLNNTTKIIQLESGGIVISNDNLFQIQRVLVYNCIFNTIGFHVILSFVFYALRNILKSNSQLVSHCPKIHSIQNI